MRCVRLDLGPSQFGLVGISHTTAIDHRWTLNTLWQLGCRLQRRLVPTSLFMFSNRELPGFCFFTSLKALEGGPPKFEIRGGVRPKFRFSVLESLGDIIQLKYTSAIFLRALSCQLTHFKEIWGAVKCNKCSYI